MVHRAGAGENYDFADDTENGRIQLCSDAGSRQTVIENGTAAQDVGISRAAVPKNSRLVARGAVPTANNPASSASSARSLFPRPRRDGAGMRSRAVIPTGGRRPWGALWAHEESLASRREPSTPKPRIPQLRRFAAPLGMTPIRQFLSTDPSNRSSHRLRRDEVRPYRGVKGPASSPSADVRYRPAASPPPCSTRQL